MISIKDLPSSFMLRVRDCSFRKFPLPPNFTFHLENYMKSGNTNYGIAFQFANDKTVSSLITTLFNSSILLCNFAKPKSSHSKSTRGRGIVFHFGTWAKYSNVPYKTLDSRQNGINWWRWKNKLLWKYVSNLVQKHFPEEFKLLNGVKCLWKFGIWTCAAFNVNFPCEPHFDKQDSPAGLCAIIVFGVFLGGEFCIADECLYIPCQQGTIIIFKSATKKHFVANYVGYRHSVTLFTPKEMIKFR